jgi:hypothetical protein
VTSESKIIPNAILEAAATREALPSNFERSDIQQVRIGTDNIAFF